MRTTTLSMLIAASLPAAFPAGAAGIKVGTDAPAFTATDSYGKPESLSDFRGRYVVLEWSNSGCPFVQHYYNHGDMQVLQKEFTDRGVAWLTVISSARGKQGYVDGGGANQLTLTRNAHPTAVLLDPAGKLGRLYDARTTPDMYVIDPAGKLIYEGAIDSIPSTDVDDIARAKPYVRLALDEAMSGASVETAVTTPYGCSIKY